jgi:hypothetical protein
MAFRVEAMMSDDKIYEIPAEWKQRGFINEAKYDELYQRSVKDPNGFWGEQARRIDWIKPFSKVKNTSYTGNVSIKWFEDGTSASRIRSFTTRCAGWPTSCATATSRRAIASPSTCR